LVLPKKKTPSEENRKFKIEIISRSFVAGIRWTWYIIKQAVMTGKVSGSGIYVED
jgi:hypothetical protein